MIAQFAAAVLLTLSSTAEPPAPPAVVPLLKAPAEWGYIFRASSLPPASRPRPETLLFDVTPGGRPVLLFGNTLVPLAVTGDDTKHPPDPFRVDFPEVPTSIAYMRDTSLLAVTGRSLVAVSRSGLRKVADLPFAGARIAAADEKQAYLFGGDTATQRRNLYLVRKDGKVLHLFEAPAPITAVAGFGDLTFIAIGRTIVYLRIGAPLVPFYQADSEVLALAPAPSGGLFFATSDRLVYVDEDSTPSLAAKGAVLPQVRGDTLYLFAHETADVLSCAQLSAVAATLREARPQMPLASSASAESIPAAARQDLDKGLAAAEKRAWRKAVESFTAAQKLAPLSPPILFDLGVACAKSGREIPAMAWLQAYLAARPEAHDAEAVRREIARLSASAQLKVARTAAMSQQIHDDLERANVRPGTIRDFSRLGAQVALVNRDFSAAEASVSAVADIGDRDGVWSRLAEAMTQWPGDYAAARFAATHIDDSGVREETLKRIARLENVAPRSAGTEDAAEAWETFAAFVSQRAHDTDLEAALRAASKADTKEIPVRIMEVATEFGCDFLRMKELQNRHPVAGSQSSSASSDR